MTFTSTSGKVAQPWRGSSDQRGAVEATWTSRPSAPTPRFRPVDTLVSRSAAAVVGDAPVRRRSRAWRSARRVERAGARHAPVGPVEQVAAEGGGLHAEGRGGGGGRGGRGIPERIPHDEAVGVRVAQGVAAVRVGVDVGGGGGRREQRTGDAHATSVTAALTARVFKRSPLVRQVSSVYLEPLLSGRQRSQTARA